MKLKSLDIINKLGVPAYEYQPFVFAPSGKTIEDLQIEEDVVLASPFSKFSIEVEGDNSLYLGGEGAILVEELSPNKYCFIYEVPTGAKNVLVKITESSEFGLDDNGTWSPVKYSVSEESGDTIYDFLLNLVNTYIGRLYAENRGTTTASKVKLNRKKGGKYWYTPSNVIYIHPKSNGMSTTLSGKKIIQMDAWTVRSHWRKLNNPESIGLDRFGNRTVIGFTWIGSYLKGEGQAQTKVRFVK